MNYWTVCYKIPGGLSLLCPRPCNINYLSFSTVKKQTNCNLKRLKIFFIFFQLVLTLHHIVYSFCLPMILCFFLKKNFRLIVQPQRFNSCFVWRCSYSININVFTWRIQLVYRHFYIWFFFFLRLSSSRFFNTILLYFTSNLFNSVTISVALVLLDGHMVEAFISTLCVSSLKQLTSLTGFCELLLNMLYPYDQKYILETN